MLNDTYAYVRARWVILVFILGPVAPMLVFDLNQPLENAIFEIVSYGLIGFLIWQIWGQNLGDSEIIGASPITREAWIYLSLGIPSIGLHYLGTYLLFMPLSFVAPEGVSSWLLEAETPDVIEGFSLVAILANIIQVFVTVLLVPIVEEIVFRGFILHRWCDKYGEKRGIVQASILFSMLHAELLGNFVWSAIMSILCLRTKSLVGPILIHISNNFLWASVVMLVWIIGGNVEGFWDGSTIKEFQSDWWYGAIGAVISVPWFYWFVKTRLLRSNTSP